MKGFDGDGPELVKLVIFAEGMNTSRKTVAWILKALASILTATRAHFGGTKKQKVTGLVEPLRE